METSEIIYATLFSLLILIMLVNLIVSLVRMFKNKKKTYHLRNFDDQLQYHIFELRKYDLDNIISAYCNSTKVTIEVQVDHQLDNEIIDPFVHQSARTIDKLSKYLLSTLNSGGR